MQVESSCEWHKSELNQWFLGVVPGCCSRTIICRNFSTQLLAECLRTRQCEFQAKPSARRQACCVLGCSKESFRHLLTVLQVVLRSEIPLYLANDLTMIKIDMSCLQANRRRKYSFGEGVCSGNGFWSRRSGALAMTASRILCRNYVQS